MAETELATCKELLREQEHVAAIHSLEALEAEVDWELGRHSSARAHLARALEEARSAPKAAAYNELMLAALIAARQGDVERAAVLSASASRLLADLGIIEDEADQERIAEIDRLVRGGLDSDEWASARERGRALLLDEAIVYALEGMRASPAG